MSIEEPNGVARLLLDPAIRSADIDVEPRRAVSDPSAGNTRLTFTMNDEWPKS